MVAEAEADAAAGKVGTAAGSGTRSQAEQVVGATTASAEGGTVSMPGSADCGGKGTRTPVRRSATAALSALPYPQMSARGRL